MRQSGLVDITSRRTSICRCLSTHSLAAVSNAQAPSGAEVGPPPLMATFKRMFGSFAASHINKQNDFSSLQAYFLQKVRFSFLTMVIIGGQAKSQVIEEIGLTTES